MPLFEELDYQQTPLGDLSLRRRRVPSLGDREIYEVKLGAAYLMSSLFHEVEVAVADLALAALDGTDLDVVVGGLGLGYTARAALRHPRVRSVLVVEALAPVIEWHRRGLVPLAEELTSDPRCRFVPADFFACAAGAGFDPCDAGRQFDAVLLDIDHSPANLLHERHASFYSVEGLRALSRHLVCGGMFSLWSDDPPDGRFLSRLGKVFASAEARVVEFENLLRGGRSESTVYLARSR